MNGGGYEAVLAALEERGLVVSTWGANISARCPAHDDRMASLSLGNGDDGRALLYCHAGCLTKEVVDALDLSMSDLWTGTKEGSVVAATYVYDDESNDPLYRVIRYAPKGFSQERYEDGEFKPGMRDVRRVLYHLPQLVRLDPEATVYITEGEKDADNLAAWAGGFATTLLGGAGKWDDSYAGYFRDRDVCIIADQDASGVGQEYARLLAVRLADVARSVRIARAATGKDLTDHLLAGLSLDDLLDADGMEVFEQWDPDEYEVEDEEWLWKPYIPRAGRVLVYGASGSLKSLWAAWLGAHIAAEGGRVAYFSLEMQKRQYAQRWKQLKHIGFEKGSYQTFGKFMFGMNLETAIKNFQGYDLLIIDSWSQAQGDMGGNDNDAVSMMDSQFFQPLIAATGATVLVIDNTGKDGKDRDGEKVANDEARGASRKKDIQETAWWLHRPTVGNNFRTKIECRKMRMNEPEPQPVIVETPQDRIEFYVVKSGYRTEEPLWPTMAIAVETAETATEIGDTPPSGEIESLRNVYAMLGAGMTRMERGQLLLQIQELERGEAEAG
jgi:hypothetical protein